jgi:hypothetical protein
MEMNLFCLRSYRQQTDKQQKTEQKADPLLIFVFHRTISSQWF